MNGQRGVYLSDLIIPHDTRLVLLVPRTELEVLISGATQSYLFKTYEPVVLSSLLEEFVADFYIEYNRGGMLDVNSLKWMPRYINNIVSMIENDIYTNIDDTIKEVPNLGTDLLYLVTEEWDGTSSMLYSLIHTRARELMYPVYTYLSSLLQNGVCVEVDSVSIPNELSIELVFRAVSKTFLETKIELLGGTSNVTQPGYGSGVGGMVPTLPQ